MGNKKSLVSTLCIYTCTCTHTSNDDFVDWNSQNNTGSKECCEIVLISTKAIIAYLLHMYCTCKSAYVQVATNITTNTMLAYESGGTS